MFIKLLYILLQILDGNSIFEVNIDLINFKKYIIESKSDILSEEEISKIDNFITNKEKNIKLLKIINKFEEKLINYLKIFI